ncbi:MAG: XTP/dITP diphosphatase [Clostridia bacterium]|nr:XTP/dITP diphosphatase [Clostridia bacterium]
MKICIASGNRGKIAELQKLLSEYITDIEIELVSLKDVGFEGDILEDGETFEENALIKARAAAEFSGLCSIADDSGLIVNALGGEPGVYSARYAGEPCDDAKNNEKLLKNLEGIGDRSAAFVCTIACVIPEGQPLSGDPIIGTGYCPGEILFNPRGKGGFGYDPLFWFDPFGKTFAEMSAEEKNAISHRGAGVKAFAEAFNKRIAEEKEKLWKRYGL